MKGWIVACLFGGCILMACSAKDSGNEQTADECPTGVLGCPCYANLTCNGSYVCDDGECKRASGLGGESAGGTAAGGDTSSGNSGENSGGGVGGSGGENAVAGSGGMASEDPEGPVFLSFGANSPTIHASEQLVISAVLTDPDGIDDVIGGTLIDPGSGAQYGAFAAQAAEGAYSIALGFGQMNTVTAINADPRGLDRTFRAEFFDVDGHKSTSDITIHLTCSSQASPYDGCCDGNVRDFRNSPNCGGCGVTCDTAPAWAANEGGCVDFVCAYDVETSTRSSCDTACGAVGAQCSVDLYYGAQQAFLGYAYYEGTEFGSGGYFDIATCADVPPATVYDDVYEVDVAFASQTCNWCRVGTAPAWVAEVVQ